MKVRRLSFSFQLTSHPAEDLRELVKLEYLLFQEFFRQLLRLFEHFGIVVIVVSRVYPPVGGGSWNL